jgi:tetratricopeptide (TPR) repeat protein
MPQVHACADHVRRYGVASLQAGHLLDRAGMYVWQRDRLDEAEALHGQALALLRTSAPRDEASIAHCLNNLATVYQQQGRITEALDHMHEALAIGRRALGAHHPRHAVHLNNLAGLRRDQGRYDEALPLYWQAVENTLRAVHEGGADLGRQTVGRAEGLARELLENLASYLNNIGVVLVKQNEPDFAGAVELFRYALGIRQVLLGSEHNRTLQSVNNLAATCGLTGQLEESLALLGGLCRAARAHPGLYSPMSLSWVYHNQANLYLRQGRYARSEARFRRALAIRRRELGPEHPLVAEELLSYSKLLDATGRTQEAEQVRREAAAIQERHLAQGQAG